MENDNRNESGRDGGQSEFDHDKKPNETSQSQQGPGGQSQQPQSSQQGSIGGQQGQQSELGQQSGQQRQQGDTGTSGGTSGQQQPLGAGHQQSADGGSVTFAGSSSDGPGAGQAGTERGEGFIGSQGQEPDPQQAGFAEQGRGAPEEGSDIERGGERNENRSTDTEGSSDR